MGAGRAVTLSSKLGSIMGQQGAGVTGMMDSLQEQTRNIGAPPLNMNDPASIQARAQWLAKRGRTDEALAMQNQAHAAMMQAEQKRKLAADAAARSAELQPINTNPLKSEVAAHNEKQEAWKALHKAGMGQYGGAVASGEMTPTQAYDKIAAKEKMMYNRNNKGSGSGTRSTDEKALDSVKSYFELNPDVAEKVSASYPEGWQDNPDIAAVFATAFKEALKDEGEAGEDASKIEPPSTADWKAVDSTLFGEGAAGVTIGHGFFNDDELDNTELQGAYRVAAGQAVAHLRHTYGMDSTGAAKQIQGWMKAFGEDEDIDPATLYTRVVEQAKAELGADVDFDDVWGE